MHVGEMCTYHTSHTHSPHTSRDAPCGVCLGVWRVVFWPSWCLVHHSTMTPFKRARRGEWAYACWRDVHVPHVAHTITTHEPTSTFWSVIVSRACGFRAKLVLGPPHYHDAFQACQTSRAGISMGSRCARGKCVPRRENMHLVACDWDYRVLFSGQVGAPHYHDAFQTCQTSRVDISMGSWCARGKCVPRRENMHLVACDWDYRVLFSGQVGAWSTTLPCHLSNVPGVASGYLNGVEMCMWHVCAKARKHASCGV